MGGRSLQSLREEAHLLSLTMHFSAPFIPQLRTGAGGLNSRLQGRIYNHRPQLHNNHKTICDCLVSNYYIQFEGWGTVRFAAHLRPSHIPDTFLIFQDLPIPNTSEGIVPLTPTVQLVFEVKALGIDLPSSLFQNLGFSPSFMPN